MSSNGKTLFGGLALSIALYMYLRRPRIEVLNTNAATKSVSYRMSINGQSITDTVLVTDAPQFIPAEDGKYIFAAITNATFGTIELSIGYMEDGGYKAIKGTIISF